MKPRIKSIALLALVFLAGILVGSTATRIAVRKWVNAAMNKPEVVQQTIERDLKRKLDLRADQQAKLHAITTRSMAELKALRSEFRPRMNAIISRSESEVREILDDQQKEKFDRFIRERSLKLAPR